jgi:hypothetical protein
MHGCSDLQPEMLTKEGQAHVCRRNVVELDGTMRSVWAMLQYSNVGVRSNVAVDSHLLTTSSALVA